MKELPPLTSIPTPPSTDLTTTAAKKTVAETSLNGRVSGTTALQPDDTVTFIDSLNGLVQARLTPDDAVMPMDNGGKTLPLSTQAAEAIRPAVPPLAVAEQTQTEADAELMSALPLVTTPADMAPADTLATTFTLSDTNHVIAGTAPQSLGTAVTESSLARVNTTVAAEQPILRDTAQITNTMNTTQSLNTTNTAGSPVIMQLSTVRPPALSQDLEPAADPVEHDLVLRSKPMPASRPVELVDRQHALTAENILNETDRLFTSRMQSMSMSSAPELTSQNLSAETLIGKTQPASADVLNASPLRSPLPQTTMVSESMTTNSQTFIPETFGKADWGQGMSKQILWMVNQNISRAEIRLNPANLGPIEVRIDMENDQVNVAFSSRHADVREAVEQALPRLREMLEEKGLNLSNTDVSQHSFAEQRQNAYAQADQNSNSHTPGPSSEVRDDQLPGDTGQVQLTKAIDDAFNNGLVDYYI